MRNSYITPHSAGRIVLLPQVAEQLNIGRDSVLYALRVREVGEPPSAVFSTIPLESWGRAFRLILYTASKPGSLRKATSLLAKHRLNLLVAWAAATSPNGELCLTSVVELPPNVMVSDLEAELSEELRKHRAHSESRLFSKSGGLRLVRIIPLRVLATLAQLYGEGPHYSVAMRSWMLDTKQCRSDKKGSLYDWLTRAGIGRRATTTALLTPDTEERYFRLSFLEGQRFRRIVFPVMLQAEKDNFSGVFEHMLGMLEAESLNVYSARDVVVSKATQASEVAGSMRGRSESGKHVEVAEFAFTVDVIDGDACTSDGELQRALTKRLAGVAKQLRRRGVAMELGPGGLKVTDIFGAEPLVFLATNAKPEMTNEEKQPVLHLIRSLRRLGLQPCNIDVKKSVAPLRREVERLLGLCPLLVSIHVPERSLLLAPRDEDRIPRHVPSAWTLFEEAQMMAKGGFIQRLRHHSVIETPFARDDLETVFDARDYEQSIAKVIGRIKGTMKMSEWVERVDQCASAVESEDPTWLQRDLEVWLLGDDNVPR